MSAKAGPERDLPSGRMSEAESKLIDAVNTLDQVNDLVRSFGLRMAVPYRGITLDLEDAMVIVDKFLMQLEMATRFSAKQREVAK